MGSKEASTPGQAFAFCVLCLQCLCYPILIGFSVFACHHTGNQRSQQGCCRGQQLCCHCSR